MLGLCHSFFGEIETIRGIGGCFENRRPLLALAAVMLVALLALPAVAQDESEGEGAPKNGAGPGSSGSFSQAIQIAVPGFHGIEPSLVISYDSGRHNSDIGHGWVLGGLSVIERVSFRDQLPLHLGLPDGALGRIPKFMHRLRIARPVYEKARAPFRRRRANQAHGFRSVYEEPDGFNQ